MEVILGMQYVYTSDVYSSRIFSNQKYQFASF
jgi:hypothetical protein